MQSSPMFHYIKMGYKGIFIKRTCLRDVNSRAPDPEAKDAKIPIDQLPKCKKDGCGKLLRPHVVWFGEGLDPKVLEKAAEELEKCDLCLVVSCVTVVVSIM